MKALTVNLPYVARANFKRIGAEHLNPEAGIIRFRRQYDIAQVDGTAAGIVATVKKDGIYPLQDYRRFDGNFYKPVRMPDGMNAAYALAEETRSSALPHLMMMYLETLHRLGIDSKSFRTCLKSADLSDSDVGNGDVLVDEKDVSVILEGSVSIEHFKDTFDALIGNGGLLVVDGRLYQKCFEPHFNLCFYHERERRTVTLTVRDSMPSIDEFPGVNPTHNLVFGLTEVEKAQKCIGAWTGWLGHYEAKSLHYFSDVTVLQGDAFELRSSDWAMISAANWYMQADCATLSARSRKQIDVWADLKDAIEEIQRHHTDENLDLLASRLSVYLEEFPLKLPGFYARYALDLYERQTVLKAATPLRLV